MFFLKVFKKRLPLQTFWQEEFSLGINILYQSLL